MSDLSTVADCLIDIAETPEEVNAIAAAIRFHDSHAPTELSAEVLADTFDSGFAVSDFRSLLYSMERADLIDDSGLNQERLSAVAGAAKVAVEQGRRPENDVVVNVPEGDDAEIGRPLGSLVVRLVELLASADDEIVILNPFFTEAAFRNIVSPIAGALNRGVSVTLITRYLSYGSDDDSRSFVREVLSESRAESSGLTLYEYVNPAGESNATIHAKMTVVDRDRAYLGTANMTHRGLEDNLEIGVIFHDDTVNQLATLVDSLLDSKYLHQVRLEQDSFVRI